MEEATTAVETAETKEPAAAPEPEPVVETVYQLHADFLLGDIRDWLLGQIKHLPKPWAKMKAEDQQRIITGAIEGASELIEKVVRIVATNGRPAIRATLQQVAVADGVKATLKLSKSDPLLLDLIAQTGGTVYLSAMSPAPFMDVRAAAHPDPDEPELRFDPDTGEIRETRPLTEEESHALMMSRNPIPNKPPPPAEPAEPVNPVSPPVKPDGTPTSGTEALETLTGRKRKKKADADPAAT